MRRAFLVLWLLLCAGLTSAQVAPVGNWVPGATGAGGCAAVTPDLWSSTYFFGAGGGSPYITLSGSPTGQIALVSSNGINKAVPEIGTRCHTTGRYYYEIQTAGPGGSDVSWGLAAATHANSLGLGIGSPNPVDSIGYDQFVTARQWVYAGSPGPGTGLTIHDGDRIGIAGDLAGLICIRNVTVDTTVWAGNTNTCDPVAQTNMFPFTPFAVPMYIAFSGIGNNPGGQGGTLCAKTACFVAPAPATYDPWDSNP